jgi:hypothetical protein
MKKHKKELKDYKYVSKNELENLKKGCLLRYISFYDLKIRYGGIYIGKNENNGEIILSIKNKYNICNVNFEKNIFFYKENKTHNDTLRVIMLNLFKDL